MRDHSNYLSNRIKIRDRIKNTCYLDNQIIFQFLLYSIRTFSIGSSRLNFQYLYWIYLTSVTVQSRTVSHYTVFNRAFKSLIILRSCLRDPKRRFCLQAYQLLKSQLICKKNFSKNFAVLRWRRHYLLSKGRLF